MSLPAKGPVAPRVRALLKRLRQGPIPARSAPPPRQLRYGDALVAFWTTLGTPPVGRSSRPSSMRRPTATARALVTPVREARGFFQEALVPAVALQCADKPLAAPGHGPGVAQGDRSA